MIKSIYKYIYKSLSFSMTKGWEYIQDADKIINTADKKVKILDKIVDTGTKIIDNITDISF